jgi:PAS domain S-box-containing protein
MTGRNPDQDVRSRSLRDRAEARLGAQTADVSSMTSRDIRALVHELQVHQVELEIQNEQLRQAQLQLAESRDRYLDLYEFAPVGYLTLDANRLIRNANLTAAGLLGVERRVLPGARLEQFVAADDRDACYRTLHEALCDGTDRTCEMQIDRPDGLRLFLRLDVVPVGHRSDGPDVCRVILADITQRKEADNERERLLAELREAVSTIHTLRGLLPICSFCKKIRDDEGYWHMIETYITTHTDARFSHGLCPDCLRREYPGAADTVLPPE